MGTSRQALEGTLKLQLGTQVRLYVNLGWYAETRKAETFQGKKKGSGQDWVAGWKLENTLIEADSKSPCAFAANSGTLSPRLVWWVPVPGVSIIGSNKEGELERYH